MVMNSCFDNHMHANTLLTHNNDGNMHMYDIVFNHDCSETAVYEILCIIP